MVVAFAHIDKTIIQVILHPVVLPAQHTHRTARVPRDIWYLVAIVVVGRIGHIYSCLIGVLQFGGQVEVLGKRKMQMRIHIHTIDLHQSQIEHGPAELLTFGIGDDLVRYAIVVVIGIDSKLRTAQICHAEWLHKTQSRTMLLSQLRLEVGIAHIRIIEVVEGWIAVALLVEGIDAQVH